MPFVIVFREAIALGDDAVNLKLVLSCKSFYLLDPELFLGFDDVDL